MRATTGNVTHVFSVEFIRVPGRTDTVLQHLPQHFARQIERVDRVLERNGRNQIAVDERCNKFSILDYARRLRAANLRPFDSVVLNPPTATRAIDAGVQVLTDVGTAVA